MENFSIAVIVALTLLAIILIWMARKYFSINAAASKRSINSTNSKTIKANKQSENYYVDNENKNMLGDDVITESNSELSYKSFDGINENPRVDSSAKLKTKDLDEAAEHEQSYDIANESIIHQPHNKKPTGTN